MQNRQYPDKPDKIEIPGLLICFKELFFPRLCVGCEQGIKQINPENSWLCNACEAAIIPLPVNFVATYILKRLKYCDLDALWSCFQLNKVIRSCIYALKYQKMPSLGIALGKRISRELAQLLTDRQEYIAIPVPLHSRRYQERGYNQSMEIAEGIFHNTRIKIQAHLIERYRDTDTQTHLTRIDRQINVKDAFRLTDASSLIHKNIFLVDDVTTTGATMNECARLLKKNGAQSVIGISLAAPIEICNAFL